MNLLNFLNRIFTKTEYMLFLSEIKPNDGKTRK